MPNKLAKIYLTGQVIFSVSVIIFGIAYALRCLFAGQIFCAACFALIGYVSGYRLFFKASMAELREYKQRVGK